MNALRVQLAATGRRATWVAVPDFAAASRACRQFIEANGLGASGWRGGAIVDTAKNVVARVSYNGRVRLPGAEVRTAADA